MKRTAFFDLHKEAGGKIVPFAGYELPVEYSGITDEHMAVRNNVGVFDVSHMGEIWVKGAKSVDFVQSITSNDVRKLSVGDAQYNCMPNGKGGIVDDIVVYYYEENKWMIVVNAANVDKDWKWMNDNIIEGVELENASDNISQLAVQGPKAIEVLQKITDIDLSSIKPFKFVVGNIGGVKDVIISATGYTGAGGFELYMYNEDAEAVWKSVFDAGKEFDIKPCGLGCRDTLRLEKGYCLYGNDIDDSTSPLEAGLGWITKFVDGNDFVDRAFLEKQKQDGVERKLVAFMLNERGIPRHDYEIVDGAGTIIGRVTSGSQSPILAKGIGLGYVSTGYSKIDTEIFIRVRKKDISAAVVKLPFV
ncbi:MAG: glycine cleavage system aminomethyltransferase GcvT [Bacteroidales bacterium]